MAVEDKIADEILSDDELDQVAGGSCYEMANDSRFLNSLNGSVNRYGATKMYFYTESQGEALKAAWAKLGIKMEYSGDLNLFNNPDSCNKYFLNGQQITQEEARQHAMKVTGHHMERKDWDW